MLEKFIDMKDNTNRILYIDSIKGVMILFVMYYHVLWTCVKFKTSPTVEVFDLVCMQTFFFVSGFVSYKKNDIFQLKDFLIILRKRIRTILLPTILMFVFFTLYFNLDFLSSFYNEFKNGYWFTYVLFVIYTLHFSLLLFYKKINFQIRIFDLLLCLLGGAMYLLYSRVYKYVDFDFCHYVSLKFVMKYYFFFVAGYMLKKYYLYLEKYIFNDKILALVLFVAFIPFVSDNKKGPFCIIELAVSLSQVLLVYVFFMKNSFFSSENATNRHLALFGRHSMEIYFIHYFFLFSMPYALDFILHCQAICFKGQPGFYFIPEIFCILPIALSLAYLSIGVRFIINLSPTISRLFFGAIPK